MQSGVTQPSGNPEGKAISDAQANSILAIGSSGETVFRSNAARFPGLIITNWYGFSWNEHGEHESRLSESCLVKTVYIFNDNDCD